MRKLTILAAILVLSVVLFGRAAAAGGFISPDLSAGGASALPDASLKIAPQVRTHLAALDADQTTTVIVTLAGQENLSRLAIGGRNARQKAIIRALRARALAGQRRIIAFLTARSAQGRVDDFHSFWVFNGLSVTATADVISELAARSDVQSITGDELPIVPVSNPALNPAGDNLVRTHAPALWDLGYAGQGVVVASMDSGVDVSHPDLAAKWRGGSNSWFDPYNQHPSTPTDLSGHGTWTMGVMVGGDSGGTVIGMAPQAQWIAVKIFDDAGSATATAVHEGFQWLLDPDGDPNTADAPHVVNNSWAYGFPGCDLEFQLDLQALVAAGIVPVFAAGNFGPGTASVSPANYPEALAVGAVNNSDQIYAYSSRGPSACGEASTVYPEIAAPGVNIWTSDLFGLYYQATGTSLAAPHVSGALALLLSAFPDLTAEQQRAALLDTAVDLGVPGPDNVFGYGRVDVLAAYQLLGSGGQNPTPTPTATATPTMTPTPTPTATATAMPDDLIFSDGFEAGDFSSWTAVYDREHDLAVSPAAALVGGKGLAALIDNRAAMYLRDSTPYQESRYRVRFYFDPNSIAMNAGNTHRIFAGRSSSAEVVRIDFRYASGAYQLRASARTDAGSYVNTSWYTISDAPHAVEFDWQAASAGANNGYLGLWIDTVLRQTKSGIDNDTMRIEEARLGPLSGLDSPTRGTELFDDFVSRRLNFIGP
ncbi:MAG: S8 family serine peptidase [Anaerolineales bacterium]|nr:S8 family serine peptidase [Anaerolineales bacterium]